MRRRDSVAFLWLSFPFLANCARHDDDPNNNESTTSSHTTPNSTHRPTTAKTTRTTRLGQPTITPPSFTQTQGPAFTTPTVDAGPAQPSHEHHHPSSRQPAVAIFGEVIGAVVGIALLLLLFRCYISYARTPRPDRARDAIRRFRLESEMTQIQEERRQSTAVAWRGERPPPPPYQRAPAYEDIEAGRHTDSIGSSSDASPIITRPILPRLPNRVSQHGHNRQESSMSRTTPLLAHQPDG